jgi:cyclopropane-fatty-acyl-phospholipid synthase
VKTPVSDIARSALKEIAGGRMSRLPFAIRFWDGSVVAADSRISEQPVVVVRSPRALAYLVREPNQLGLARAWVTGSLDVEGDLEAVLAARHALADVSLSPRDRALIASAALRSARLSILRRAPIPAIEARPSRGSPHSLSRDRAAVRHHYNVSNDFYELVLGPSMTYSCAYFSSPDDTLEQAQERKHDLICRKLQLGPGERLLDVGCGWGSLLLHAATRYGARGIGITLSEPQAELARRRVREAGVSDLVEIRVADYREITDGPFDKVASVGMYEHVGLAEYGHYVETIRGLLRDGGLVLNHGIARLASEQPRADTFIARYIFPDGELHPVTEIMSAMQSRGLEVRDLESMREHYPLTLRRWVANLGSKRDRAVALVGSERERAWRLYMLASAVGFESGDITICQVLAARTGAPHRLPLDRTKLIGAGPAAGRDPSPTHPYAA